MMDAMNKGIMMATGDVIGILNSDDFYTSDNVLSTIVDNIRDVDAVYADIHYVNSNDTERPVRYYSSASFAPWKMRMGFMPAHPSFYCRKRLYMTYGLFDVSFRVAADFEQLLRLIYVNGIKCGYVDKDFVTMRTGGASTSGFKSHRMILKDHLRAYRKNGVKSNLLMESVRYVHRIFEMVCFNRKK